MYLYHVPKRKSKKHRKTNVYHEACCCDCDAGGAIVAMAPQFLHLRSSSVSLKWLTASLIWVPRLVQWKAASCTTSPHSLQYHRSRSRDLSGRFCSITMPTYWLSVYLFCLGHVFGGTYSICVSHRIVWCIRCDLLIFSLNTEDRTGPYVVAETSPPHQSSSP